MFPASPPKPLSLVPSHYSLINDLTTAEGLGVCIAVAFHLVAPGSILGIP